MIIKNVINGVELNLKNAEENDIYYVSITKNEYNLTIKQYPKHTWIKVNDKDDYLRLILKDFNKLHMFGFSKIEKTYDGTDLIIFGLYSSDFKTASLSYDKDTRTMYFNCCKIESDDLKSSIESYLSLLNKE
jgi:hypothetical protein